MKNFFKKLIKIIPLLVWCGLVCNTALDIHLSFSRYHIVMAVADTASLNLLYEKPILNVLRRSGHVVRLAYADSLVSDNAIGATKWTDFDLVIVPNFVKCPVIDTTKKIGEVPVICLEDSLWDDFGFIPTGGSSEPFLWVADYQNARIVKTKFDGTDWSSFATNNSRYPVGIAHYMGASGIDTSVTYLSFYRSGTACDTLFRTTWGYGSVSKFGRTGGAISKSVMYFKQFNRPTQLFSARHGSSDYLVVADRVNDRGIWTKWQATDSTSEWSVHSTNGQLFGSAYLEGKAGYYDLLMGNTKIYKNRFVGAVGDSLYLGSTGGYLWPTHDFIYASNGTATGKIWKISTATFAVTDSLSGGKIGTPNGVWFDSTSSYLYWADGGGKLKRAKFDGTADGTLLDSCFTSGSGDDKLNAPRGLSGYSVSAYSPLGAIADDDTAYVSFNTDSITSVFSTGYSKIYSSNGDITGIDPSLFTSGNILMKDKSNTYATVVIDTINSVKRIAFGLYDVSKLNIFNNSFPSSAGQATNSLPTGWELFNRCIGRLKESEKDSIFNLVYVKDFPYSGSPAYFQFTSNDSSIRSFFNSNMQRIAITEGIYTDSAYYDYNQYGWEDADLVITGESLNSPDSLRTILNRYNKPWLVLGGNSSPMYPMAYMLEETSYLYSYGRVDTVLLTYANNSSHQITSTLSYSLNDTINWYKDDPFPVTSTLLPTLDGAIYNVPGGYDYYNGSIYHNLTNSILLVVADVKYGATTYKVGTVIARTNKPWLYFSNRSRMNTWHSNVWGLFEEGLTWVIGGTTTLLAPSGIVVSSYTSDSLIVSWTDNSSNELGFKTYLEYGGDYLGSPFEITTVDSNVVADTVGVFWPPNSLWYLDVGSYDSTTVKKSGVSDSAYTLSVKPPTPIVYALKDTAMNVILNGYEWYDLFNDTTLALNPQWYRPFGSWNVEKRYNRLRSWNTLDSTTIVGTGIATRKAINFNGTSQYAYRADSDSLDVKGEDFAYSIWIYRAGGLGTDQRVVSKRIAVNNCNELFFAAGSNTLQAVIGAKSTFKTIATTDTIGLNLWHQYVFVGDRDGNGYWFVNGVYDNADALTSVDSVQNNTGIFNLGTGDFGGPLTQPFSGKVSNTRFLRFGVDGLTVTGAYGTSNLLIKKGSDTLYCQATLGGLVKDLYDFPDHTLTTLGFPSLETNLKAYWKFSEASGADTLYDETSNNLDLITVGNPSISLLSCNTISSITDTVGLGDTQISFKYHFNDSLRLNKQWIKFYFISSDSIGQGNGYYLYADSSKFQVVKQTANAPVDTLVNTTYTGDYKWKTVLVTVDKEQNPSTLSYTWKFYLDGDSLGVMSDTTYHDYSWFVLEASHRRMWFDSFWIRGLTPSSNDDSTHYCIQDSISSKYLDASHNLTSSTAIWQTFSEWGGEDGFYFISSPYSHYIIRSKSRSGR
jgi:hypothetical protein